MNRKYTWKKQKIDSRDYPFEKLVKIKSFATGKLPNGAYNRKWCSEVQDQADEGSCTANAWTGLLQYNSIKNGVSPYRNFSRNFIYYNERVIEGTVDQDSGAELRDGANSLANYGVCLEGDWPYDSSNLTTKPSDICYADALKRKIHSYYALNTLDDMRTCLANGQCFVFGFNVYDYFESTQMANTGILYLPTASEQLVGGHAVMAMGYNDAEKRFLVKNSWGTGWGLSGNLSGYFTIPYDYMTDPNLASDFWTVLKDV